MNRTSHLQFPYFSNLSRLLGILLSLTPFSLFSGTTKPNLVFVFTDQHSSDMLGCYGNREIITPNIDRLASQGVRFHHCVSNSPVCTPYRGMLLSGKHPLHNGAFQNDVRMLPGNGNYLGEVLRDGGYRTGYIGKWHLYGGDRDRGIPPGPYRYGFDHEFLTNNCTLVYDAERSWYWDQDGETRKFYGEWESDGQARQALEFVERHADKPFALFLSWHPPHNWGRAHEGYDAPPDLLQLYDPAKLTLRPSVKDSPEVRRAYQGHMAMITGIDRAFGKLMDKLEEHKLAENTIVIFTSDHGDTLMSYDWPNNKGRAEHVSSRVPLIIRWPARLQPGTSELLIGTLDLMPSLLGLLGLPVPPSCQGRNTSQAILEGRDDGVNEQPLLFTPLNWRGVYTKRYTYSVALHEPSEPGIAGGKDTFNVLYDRKNDPWETRNLFADPASQALKEQLHSKTLELMARFNDGGSCNSEIVKRVLNDEDLSAVLTPPGKRQRGWESRLKGAPYELMKNIEPKNLIQP
jgi:arylsulfatase A-like enzyme